MIQLDRPRSKTSPAERDVVESMQMRSKRIIVVDDDPRIADIVKRCLQAQGYEVHATRRPPDALRLADRVRPHLAILDVSMPGKDGFELAKQIVSRPRTGKIRVMFLTGRDAGSNIAEAKDSGALGYLQKPFKPDDLLRMVKNVLAIPRPT